MENLKIQGGNMERYTLVKILNKQGKTLVNEVLDIAKEDIEVRFCESDKESFEYIGTSKGICRGCFSTIDIASWNGCPYCGRKLKGEYKKKNNLKLFLEEGIISRSFKLIRLRFENLREYRRYKTR